MEDFPPLVVSSVFNEENFDSSKSNYPLYLRNPVPVASYTVTGTSNQIRFYPTTLPRVIFIRHTLSGGSPANTNAWILLDITQGVFPNGTTFSYTIYSDNTTSAPGIVSCTTSGAQNGGLFRPAAAGGTCVGALSATQRGTYSLTMVQGVWITYGSLPQSF